MILSREDIEKEVADGRIKFAPPLEDKQWGPASVDLRLGHEFIWFKNLPGLTVSLAEGIKALGGLDLWDRIDVNGDGRPGGSPGFDIRPGVFILGGTLERITVPRDLIASVEGRSTYARFGLSMHQTAPWLQPGWEGHLTLEIMNNGSIPVKLTPEVDHPCQLTFFRLSTKVPEDAAYGARDTDAYQGQEHAVPLPD